MGVEGLRRLRVRDSSDQEEVNWTQNSQLKNTNKKSHSQPLIPSNPTTGDDDLIEMREYIWDVTENSKLPKTWDATENFTKSS